MDKDIAEEVLAGKRKKTILIIVISVAVLELAIWLLRSSFKSSLSVSKITTADVEMGTMENTISASGEILPEFEQVITSPVKSIGDFSHGKALAKFLDRLDSNNQLAKTILYNLNPADNELMATMIGNFNDGSEKGKIQFGSAWWFLHQKDGMIKQLNALSNMGLLSRFIGMLTDSRSFLSFPRHEYFRRILCNLFGSEIENGELPNDIDWIGKVIQDISYHNAANYFNWQEKEQPVKLHTV
jgi:hypothetical protein